MQELIKSYCRESGVRNLQKQVEKVGFHLRHVITKPALCICDNKGAGQLRGNRAADQRLCFRYIDSAIPLLSKSEIGSL